MQRNQADGIISITVLVVVEHRLGELNSTLECIPRPVDCGGGLGGTVKSQDHSAQCSPVNTLQEHLLLSNTQIFLSIASNDTRTIHPLRGSRSPRTLRLQTFESVSTSLNLPCSPKAHPIGPPAHAHLC